MRINKFISHNTKYSRRDADKLISDGEVKIGRQVITDLSYIVQEDDHISVKGRPVVPTTEITVLVYNKPKGVLVTKKDDRGRATIYHKLSGKYRHFIPVGRLDYASEGLLLLTDTPRVAEALMNSDLPRTYNLKLDIPVNEAMVEAMKDGLVLEDATAGGHANSDIRSMTFAPFDNFEMRDSGAKNNKLRVTISEGKNRELRRFFAHFGAKVVDLKRISYGDISLNNLPTNKTRYFTRREYDDLHKFLKSIAKEKLLEEKKPRYKSE